jgi:hypothetical protein
MRKYALLCLLLIPVAGTGAQSPKPSARPQQKKAAPEPPKQNLSDDFAKAGIKALRAIERSMDKPTMEGGSITVPRGTQELIDNADAEARAEEEKAVVAALHEFYVGRLTNNLERQILTPASYNEESEAKAQAELEKNPRNIDLNAHEAACAKLLDDILRARHYTEKPAACYEVHPPKDKKP